jgi:folate-dependent phosphoribosylglycinamide formyltransferase PurN
MKFTLITGDHLRHLYLADFLYKKNFNFDWIIEKREKQIPLIDKKFNKDIKKLFLKHFKKRAQAEINFFGKQPGKLAIKNIKSTTRVGKNNYDEQIFKVIKNSNNNNLITYGCGLLSQKILKKFSGYKLNIHAGLSPRYRGAATHFWPSYLMEPEYTGVTLHELTKEVDGGNIFHQTSIKVSKNHGIHQNSCLAIREFFFELPKVLNFLSKSKKKIRGIKQLTSGRIWTEKMWSPLTLKLVYGTFNDDINNYCLKNKIIKKIKLKSILKN